MKTRFGKIEDQFGSNFEKEKIISNENSSLKFYLKKNNIQIYVEYHVNEASFKKYYSENILPLFFFSQSNTFLSNSRKHLLRLFLFDFE